MRRSVSIVAAVVLLGAAIVFAARGTWPWPRWQERAVEPDTTQVALFARHTVEDTLHRGETIGDLFARHGVVLADLGALTRSIGLDPRRLRAGLVFSFLRDPSERAPSEIVVRTSADERVRFIRAGLSWSGTREPIRWISSIVRVAATIEQSLYTALDGAIADSIFAAGERTAIAWDVADVYAWNVDFSRDLQPGDSLTLLVERLVSEEGDVRAGRVLAGDLRVSGRQLTAFRFHDAQNRPAFYDAEGKSLRRAFLSAPVAFRRISSNFSRARFHPVLKIWRRHEGTDYAASAGTDVMAAADGRVVRAGWWGGYGNVVEIRHKNGITTRYGHLRRIASTARVGAYVVQGDVIGSVGMTGLASAPHLHYEFRINGAARDPRRVNLGSGDPLPANLYEPFATERTRLTLLLAGVPIPASLHLAD